MSTGAGGGAGGENGFAPQVVVMGSHPMSPPSPTKRPMPGMPVTPANTPINHLFLSRPAGGGSAAGAGAGPHVGASGVNGSSSTAAATVAAAAAAAASHAPALPSAGGNGSAS